MQEEELRALVKDKLLAVLPAVSFQALLDYAVPGKMGRELVRRGPRGGAGSGQSDRAPSCIGSAPMSSAK